MTFKPKFNETCNLAVASHPGHLLMEFFDYAPVETVKKVLMCDDNYYNKLLSCDPMYGLNRTMCVRLAHFFNTTYEFWDGIQKQYEIVHISTRERELADDIDELKSSLENSVGYGNKS